MAIKWFFILFLAELSFSQVYGQENLVAKIYFYPMGMHLGNSHVKEYGLGTYEFNYKRPFNIEIGGILSRKIFSHYYLDMGLNIKYWNLEFEYIINDPFYEVEIVAHEERFMRKIMGSPHLGVQYMYKKFTASIGVEANLEITSENNVISGRSPIYIFIDPVGQRSAYFEVREDYLFFNKLDLFLTPTLSLGYKILPKFSFEFNAKIKPYGDWPLYLLEIGGKTAEMPEGYYQLNDTRILNSLIFIHLGVSYSLDLKPSVLKEY